MFGIKRRRAEDEKLDRLRREIDVMWSNSLAAYRATNRQLRAHLPPGGRLSLDGTLYVTETDVYDLWYNTINGKPFTPPRAPS